MIKRMFLIFAFALPLFGGGYERFPLPRTVGAMPYQIEASAQHLWTRTPTHIIQSDANGVVIDAYLVYPTAMTVDPLDGGVWFARHGLIGKIMPAGEVTYFYGGLQYVIGSIVVGSDDAIWVLGYGHMTRMTRAGDRTDYAYPSGILYQSTLGPDGNIWGVESEHRVVRVKMNGEVSRFDAGLDFPFDIVNGPNGKLWVTTTGGSMLSVTTDGVITTPFTDYGGYRQLAAGSDGMLYIGTSTGKVRRYDPATNTTLNIWDVSAGEVWGITTNANGVWWGDDKLKFGRVQSNGTVTSAPFTPITMTPGEMVAVNDQIWFPADGKELVKMSLAGAITRYPLPNGGGVADVALGADGALWFTEPDGNRIGRINVTTGAIQEYALPTAGSTPTDIARGGDNNLWFTMPGTDQIGRITAAGVITEFPVPFTGANSGLSSIVKGADNNIWFSEATRNKIGRITTSGVITEFSSQGSNPGALSLGADGMLWYYSYAGMYRMTHAGDAASLGNQVYSLHRIIGPDGLQWSAGSTLSRMYPDLRMDKINPPPADSLNGQLVLASDGHVWASGLDAIYRVTLDTATISASGASLCLPESRLISGTIATFSDPDPTRDASHYSATVNWDDGPSSLTEAAVTKVSGGQYAVSATRTLSSFTSRTLNIEINALPSPGRIGGTAWASSAVNTPVPEKSIYNFAGSGGTQPVNLPGMGSCPWSATSNRSWITIGGSGATMLITVEKNTTGVARSGEVRIGVSYIAINQSAEAPTHLYLVTPCRLFDSRDSNVKLAAGISEEVTASGRCGIPVNAQAIVANLTVVSPADAGWLAAFRASYAWSGVSTLSYRKGKTRANSALIGLNEGVFSMFNGGSVPVHFIVDVTGYFQ